MMIRAGIVTSLVKCLGEPHKKLIAQTSYAIYFLVNENKRNQNDFRKAGVIPPLLNHLSEQNYFSDAGKPTKSSNTVKVAVLDAVIALCRNNRK